MLFLSGKSQEILKSDACGSHGTVFYSVSPELKQKKEKVLLVGNYFSSDLTMSQRIKAGILYDKRWRLSHAS